MNIVKALSILVLFVCSTTFALDGTTHTTSQGNTCAYIANGDLKFKWCDEAGVECGAAAGSSCSVNGIAGTVKPKNRFLQKVILPSNNLKK